MKHRKETFHDHTELMEKSLIVCLALIAVIALNFLYARRAFAALPTDADESNLQDEIDVSLPDDTTTVTTYGLPPVVTMPLTETSFLARMHSVNQQEIQMGELARQNGEQDKVKRYGNRLEDDHRYIDQRLLSLAEKMGVDLASVPEVESDPNKAAEQTQISRISRETGASFDSHFLEMMDQSHRQGIDLLISGRNQLPMDSKARIFAGQIIPILQQHLDVVNHLQEKY